jgi:hypothetical protein
LVPTDHNLAGRGGAANVAAPTEADAGKAKAANKRRSSEIENTIRHEDGALNRPQERPAAANRKLSNSGTVVDGILQKVGLKK